MIWMLTSRKGEKIAPNTVAEARNCKNDCVLIDPINNGL